MVLVNTDDISFTTEQLQLITAEQAWQYRIVPKASVDGLLELFTDEESLSRETVEELELLTGNAVKLHLVPRDVITGWLGKYYLREKKDSRIQNLQYTGSADDFLGHLIGEARSLKSSDIHIEAYEERCRVRIRIDGMLVERYVLNKTDYPSLVNKIKILSNLDIAERRLPQDGRVHFNQGPHKFDIRVSVLPTLYGEKIVLRLLNNNAADIGLETLGFSELDLRHYLEGAKRPNGILLISGPTGSGKTTTLYATLKLLNRESRNIITIEDPIEYTLEGINQVQLKESIGLTFSAALRNFLRQDPDIIMVGEIRDVDTAGMAIRAALTGHLVLSTIHTNSAWGTVSRLVDMGIPPFLVAGTLNTTVAQRLLRLLCPSCKRRTAFSEESYPRQFRPFRKVHEHFLPEGCDHCHHTGYKGRKAVYEVIPIDYELSENIRGGASEVSELLKARGVKSLAENAFELFERGETSLEEIYPLLFNF